MKEISKCQKQKRKKVNKKENKVQQNRCISKQNTHKKKNKEGKIKQTVKQ